MSIYNEYAQFFPNLSIDIPKLRQLRPHTIEFRSLYMWICRLINEAGYKSECMVSCLKRKTCVIFPEKEKAKGGEMATKTIKVSDLTGEEIGAEENLARIVVEEHPNLTDPVTLEVLAEEVEDQLPVEQNFVRVTYFPPSES